MACHHGLVSTCVCVASRLVPGVWHAHVCHCVGQVAEVRGLQVQEPGLQRLAEMGEADSCLLLLLLLLFLLLLLLL